MIEVLDQITVDKIIAAGRADLLHEYADGLTPLEKFEPRPDNPALFDEQTSFINSTAKFSVVCGGNRSGKTVCAAYKTARYLLETEPYRVDCPFWVLGETYELVAEICWKEKLRYFIPRDAIMSIAWEDQKRGLPRVVVLKHPKIEGAKGWAIEFKTYDQGPLLMQGRSIGGYWFNEEAPLAIVQEVQARCSDYDAHGWADFTPIHLREPGWLDKYDEPPEGWQFYRMNALCNEIPIIKEWARTYFPSLPAEERETRETGAFGNFRGQVFKEFNRRLHVLDASKMEAGYLKEVVVCLENHVLPTNWKAIRGIDFGYSQPFACVWVAIGKIEGDTVYVVYDEHFAAQRLLDYHYACISRRPWSHNPIRYGSTYCDSEDPGSIRLLEQLGLKGLSAANKGWGTVREGISVIRTLMLPGPNGRTRWYCLSKCENLIREIRAYHWQQPIGKDLRMHNPIDEPVKWDDHALDAMRYAIFTHLTGTGKAPQAVRQNIPTRPGIQLHRGRELE